LRTRFPSSFREGLIPLINFEQLNNARAPFANVAARRALSYAIDRRILNQALGGQSIPSCQLLPPNFPGYRPYCPYTVGSPTSRVYRGPDLETAKRLAAASGTRGDTVRMAAASTWGKPAAHYLATVLRSLGYRTHVTLLSDTAYTALRNSKRLSDRYDLFAAGWQADWPSPLTFFGPLVACATGPSSPNSSGFCNHRIDREVARARALEGTSPQAAEKLWAQIDRDVTDQAPYLVLSSGKWFTVLSKRAGNFQHSLQWGPLLSQIWVR
jgi:peptide/nickel transport system substrate-binding protein